MRRKIARWETFRLKINTANDVVKLKVGMLYLVYIFIGNGSASVNCYTIAMYATMSLRKAGGK